MPTRATVRHTAHVVKIGEHERLLPVKAKSNNVLCIFAQHADGRFDLKVGRGKIRKQTGIVRHVPITCTQCFRTDINRRRKVGGDVKYSMAVFSCSRIGGQNRAGFVICCRDEPVSSDTHCCTPVSGSKSSVSLDLNKNFSSSVIWMTSGTSSASLRGRGRAREMVSEEERERESVRKRERDRSRDR